MSPFFTATEAAEFLRVSRCQIYALIREGKIQGRKHGGKVVVPIDEAKAFSERGIMSPKQTPRSRFQDARERVRNRSLTTGYTAISPTPEKGVG